MCGIAGYLDIEQRADVDRPDIIANLLTGIEIRGRHATGYAYLGADTTIVCKADMAASEFVDAAPLFTDGLNENPRSMLLHTRYATQGDPAVNQNNHPIHSKFTGLTLIHNGWLTNERQLLAKYGLRKDADVDSETVLRLIEHFVTKERKRVGTAIKLAMAELQGKFACALISEKHPDALWLWTKGNPLAGYRDDETGMFYFASTPEILERSLRRSGIKPKKIGALADGRLLTLTVHKGKFKGHFSQLKLPTKKKQKPIINQHPLIGMPRKDEKHNKLTCSDRCTGKITAVVPCRCKCHGAATDLVEKRPDRLGFCEVHQRNAVLCKAARAFGCHIKLPYAGPTATNEGWSLWKRQGEKIKRLLN